jgi:hypothetical protein
VRRMANPVPRLHSAASGRDAGTDFEQEQRSRRGTNRGWTEGKAEDRNSKSSENRKWMTNHGWTGLSYGPRGTAEGGVRGMMGKGMDGGRRRTAESGREGGTAET